MAREINLVPDIKDEMIKTLKLRNLIFFLCIIVASASIGVTLIFGLIAGGQRIAIDSKDATIKNLSNKLNSYDDLNDFITIKDQLSNISTLTGDKKVLSRTFNILSALLPTGADTITISELNVNLSEEAPTFSFDAQADAGKEPFIDYNVLDSFKKSMQYMRYDYGHYVDKNGDPIPAYCIIESGPDGAFFVDSEKGMYAYWTINGDGCDSSTESAESDDEETSTATNSTTKAADSYTTESYEGNQVVRIWRTPQYQEWYQENETENKPYMDLNGNISNVQHFESECISYSGKLEQGSTIPKWTENNDSCMLVPDGNDGITISDSSNGRNSSDELVLRFSSTIRLAPEVYDFNNTHMLAIAPSGRRNVTDSYVQLQAMFGERARDCAEGDTACNTNTNGGEE